jgi:hypothetical protein
MTLDERDYIRVGQLEIPNSLDSDDEINIFLDAFNGWNIWMTRDEAKTLIRQLVRVFAFCQSEVAGHD